jgi:hypothetical protein
LRVLDLDVVRNQIELGWTTEEERNLGLRRTIRAEINDQARPAFEGDGLDRQDGYSQSHLSLDDKIILRSRDPSFPNAKSISGRDALVQDLNLRRFSLGWTHQLQREE